MQSMSFWGCKSSPMSLAILKTILTSFSVAASLNDLPRFLIERIIYTNENNILCVFGDFVLHFIIAHESLQGLKMVQ
jgi:hypothetical protein